MSLLGLFASGCSRMICKQWRPVVRSAAALSKAALPAARGAAPSCRSASVYTVCHGFAPVRQHSCARRLSVAASELASSAEDIDEQEAVVAEGDTAALILDAEADESASEPSEALVPAVAVVAAAPQLQEAEATFMAMWTELQERLRAGGFYSLDTETATGEGLVKHSILACGRARADLLYALEPQKIVQLLRAGDLDPGQFTDAVPLSDRKVKNSVKRLKATYLEGTDLDGGVGGAAATIDLMRVLMGVYFMLSPNTRRQDALRDVTLHTEFLIAATAVIDDLLPLIDQDPLPEAQAKAEEAAAQREAAQRTARSNGRADSLEFAGRQFGRGREPRGNNSVKPGDWMCQECNAHNFSRNRTCFVCAAPRSADAVMPSGPAAGRNFGDSDMRPGDWMCPECNGHNFSRKTECFSCSAPRPQSAGFRSEGSFGGRPSFGGGRASYGREQNNNARPGDWICPSCEQDNFARRSECFKCGEPRPEGMGQPQGGGRAFGGRPQPEMRPGDWMCPDCSAHNFSTKTECYRCGVLRPESAGPPVIRRPREEGRPYSPRRDRFSSDTAYERDLGGGYGPKSDVRERSGSFSADLDW